MHRTDGKYVNILVGKPEGRYDSEDLDIDGRITITVEFRVMG